VTDEAERPPNHRITLEIALEQVDPERELEELRTALEETPRRIPTRYFYDRRGSELFERITELPEYYPTRAERELLAEFADEIAGVTGAAELVELGSGAATKTRLLLDAMARAGNLRTYVPLDVSEAMVRRSAVELAAAYPELTVRGLVADFHHDLDHIPEGEPRLVVFLGSTIGNLRPDEAVAFLRGIAAPMAPGDFFLLGIDLVKQISVIEAAYNDSRGLTAEFNRNILRVVNRLAGGDFRSEAFAHRAFFDPRNRWIEMRLVARQAQTVRLGRLDLTLELAAGEEILTEISCKYERPQVEGLLDNGGFSLGRWFEHPDALFALALARRRRGDRPAATGSMQRFQYP
jgi:L-histidine N-alpha-methyltransferase